MRSRIISFALLLASLACAPAYAQTTYAVGNWTVNARQDKGIKWLFNKLNNGLLDAALAGTAPSGPFINAAGSGYHVDDVVTLVDNGTCASTATLKVTTIGAGGSVTGLQVLTYGSCTTRQAASNHQTIVSPIGGTGLVLRVNYYVNVAAMLTRNGGVLDVAVNSYAQQREQERNDKVRAALDGASDTQVGNALAVLGVVDPQ